MAAKPKKQASGGARLKASGKKAVLIGLTPDEHFALTEAATLDRRPLTVFLTLHGLAAAAKLPGLSARSRKILDELVK